MREREREREREKEKEREGERRGGKEKSCLWEKLTKWNWLMKLE